MLFFFFAKFFFFNFFRASELLQQKKALPENKTTNNFSPPIHQKFPASGAEISYHHCHHRRLRCSRKASFSELYSALLLLVRMRLRLLYSAKFRAPVFGSEFN